MLRRSGLQHCRISRGKGKKAKRREEKKEERKTRHAFG
jgi:hypothetical protein